jgi:heptosyltransferase-2
MESTPWLKQMPKNIIVRMPNWLGDLVMATPVLAEIRKKWPKARITAMAQNKVAALLKEDPHIDELYAFHKPSGWIHRQPERDIVEALRCGNYDLGILLTNSFSSAWLFWRGHVKNRIGYPGHWRRYLLDKVVPLPKDLDKQHQISTYKSMLSPLSIELSGRMPKLYVSDNEVDIAKRLLRKLGVTDKHILVGINPGAAYGSAKCWPPQRFKQVVQRLLENPLIRVIFFGDPNGKSLIEEICYGLPERVVNLAGKTTIRELMTLIGLCHVFLTNDSGPMHIASALNTPTVSLFGSTSDVRTGPYGEGCVIHKHVECAPCYKRECPLDFRCMMNISVDEVYNELQKYIKKVRL